MAIKKEKKGEAQYLPNIQPGTPEMESFLAAGYPRIGTRAHAQEIIKTRQERPELVPWELEQEARAYIAALDAKSQVIAVNKPGRLDDIQSVE